VIGNIKLKLPGNEESSSSASTSSSTSETADEIQVEIPIQNELENENENTSSQESTEPEIDHFSENVLNVQESTKNNEDTTSEDDERKRDNSGDDITITADQPLLAADAVWDRVDEKNGDLCKVFEEDFKEEEGESEKENSEPKNETKNGLKNGTKVEGEKEDREVASNAKDPAPPIVPLTSDKTDVSTKMGTKRKSLTNHEEDSDQELKVRKMETAEKLIEEES